MPSSQPLHESSAPVSLLEAINAALAVDDAMAAVQLCQERLASAPDDPDAHRYLNQIYARQRNLDTARTAARRATEFAPKDPRAWSDPRSCFPMPGSFIAGETSATTHSRSGWRTSMPISTIRLISRTWRFLLRRSDG